MAKKGRQTGGKKQANPRKQRAGAQLASEAKDKTNASPERDVTQQIEQENVSTAPTADLGRVLGLTNLGHTCFFNAAVQVGFCREADPRILMI